MKVQKLFMDLNGFPDGRSIESTVQYRGETPRRDTKKRGNDTTGCTQVILRHNRVLLFIQLE